MFQHASGKNFMSVKTLQKMESQKVTSKQPRYIVSLIFMNSWKTTFIGFLQARVLFKRPLHN